MDDSDMQDANLAQSQPATGDQALAFPTFNHGNLSIRNNVPASFQSPTTQTIPQSDVQSTAQASLDTINAHFTNLQANPNHVAQICAQGSWEQLGPGRKTPEDVYYFFQFNRYPARSVDDLEIDIEFTLDPKDGDTFTSMIIQTLPASSCNSFSSLFKATKDVWTDVFKHAIAPFPITGIWPRNLTVMFKETHGDDRGNWKAARNPERYEKWYNDHVVHGRNRSLKLHLMYKEVA